MDSERHEDDAFAPILARTTRMRRRAERMRKWVHAGSKARGSSLRLHREWWWIWLWWHGRWAKVGSRKSPAEVALLVGTAERLRVRERIENLLPRRGTRARESRSSHWDGAYGAGTLLVEWTEFCGRMNRWFSGPKTSTTVQDDGSEICWNRWALARGQGMARSGLRKAAALALWLSEPLKN
jgi:hypothetical protein